MSNRGAMLSTALLVVLASTPAHAAPPPGRAWECPISQRLRCAPRGCVAESARGYVATIDPNGGHIIPCDVGGNRGATYECLTHDAGFERSTVRGELNGVALHGVPLFAVVRADNTAILTYILGDTVYISRGQCREADAPIIVQVPTPVQPRR